MTTPNVTSSTDRQMHNNIMAAGSRDRPPMLAPGRYPQWRSWFLRYVDTRPNGKALRKCILSGPYKPTTVLVQAVEATDDSLAVPEHTTHRKCGKLLKGYNKPEWSRFVTIVKKQHKLDEVSYQKHFDILNQYQNEVNELRAERLARNANPLALVATTQADQDQYYQTSRSQRLQAPSSKPLIPTRSHASTRHKGKEIAKPTTPLSETAFEEDNDPEQAQRDKDMQKNLSGQFGNQRTVNVAAARENVGSKVVQQSGIQCFNCREFGHFAKECRKPKMVKDSAYHKQKMLLCKQAEQGVPLQADQYDCNTCLVETDDRNAIPDSPNMCEDDIQNDQNDVESDDERVALANLKLVVDENKKIQKQLKKANTTLAQELKERKAILVKTSMSLGESISVRDSCLVAFQTKQAEFGKYKAFNDRTIDYEKLKRKLKEPLGQLAQKDTTKQAEFEKFKAFNDRTVGYDKIKRKLNEALGQLAHKDTITREALGQLAHKDTVTREGLKTKTYELSVVKEKHKELLKESLLTKSHYEGLVKQKTKVITDLKFREEHDIEKMLSMEKQLKFLNEIIYKRSQSIHTIHMMAPKVPTYNGRPTFANPRYLKQAQSKIPCLYAFPYDQNTHANRLIPDGEETLALERESRSKLNKDSVRPYDYTTLNSLYEIFKPPTQEYETQLAHANEIKRKIWQKSFVKSKTNIYKNVRFLPVSKSISKSR
nr:hypothetical protein [Tanacetum cinerariifolium]